MEHEIAVEVPDAAYFRNLVPCMAACPVHTDAGAYVRAIAEGRDEEAYGIAAAPNPFVSVCGRVCAHPCEGACRRGRLDEPVSIRALKRFVCERHGVESIHAEAPQAFPEGRGPKVAIVGGGPAGIACAHYLLRWGYRLTLFDAAPHLGGMLRLGIPEYRLRRDILSREVDRVLARGVDLRLWHALGSDITLDSLFGQGYQATFLAIGARRSRLLDIEGASLDGVVNGLDFLLNVNLGYKVDLGSRVVVVGGGNVAMDVARVSLRATGTHEAAIVGKTLMDAARAAVRLGARQVSIACVESREEMPAFAEEIDDAIEEGVHLYNRVGPVSIVGEGGKVVGLVIRKVSSVFDEQGRFRPTFVPGTEELLPADTVILAVGQTVDRLALESVRGLKLHPGGTIVVDPTTLETSVEGVYAGGDVAFGPRNVIEAVADGRKAATAIHNRLGGSHRRSWRIRFRPATGHAPPAESYRVRRQRVPAIAADRRTGFTEVETGYDEATARREANRCLRCHIQTVFDSAKCIMCGGCVDICPERCLHIVEASRLRSQVDLGPLLEDLGSEEALAIIKDEDICIRCGLCAERCPVKAITMELMEIGDVETDD